jgi:short coiled-coil protein
MSGEHDPTPSLADPVSIESRNVSKSQPSSSASSINDGHRTPDQQRPKLGLHRHSASIIVDRDSSQLELTDEVYDEDDARTMSPRRNSQDVQKMGEQARRALEEYAIAEHS